MSQETWGALFASCSKGRQESAEKKKEDQKARKITKRWLLRGKKPTQTKSASIKDITKKGKASRLPQKSLEY